jgi:hypothetical protein
VGKGKICLATWKAGDVSVNDTPREGSCHEETMTIELNHTVVPARDKIASAKFFARLFGLSFDEQAIGYFAPVRVNETLTLDFDDDYEATDRSTSITMRSRSAKRSSTRSSGAFRPKVSPMGRSRTRETIGKSIIAVAGAACTFAIPTDIS